MWFWAQVYLQAFVTECPWHCQLTINSWNVPWLNQKTRILSTELTFNLKILALKIITLNLNTKNHNILYLQFSFLWDFQLIITIQDIINHIQPKTITQTITQKLKSYIRDFQLINRNTNLKSYISDFQLIIGFLTIQSILWSILWWGTFSIIWRQPLILLKLNKSSREERFCHKITLIFWIRSILNGWNLLKIKKIMSYKPYLLIFFSNLGIFKKSYSIKK